jgi:hypothetical protein
VKTASVEYRKTSLIVDIMGPGLLSPTVYELAYQIKYKSENSSSLLGNVFQLLVHDLPSDTARWACALAFAKYILTENENLRA